MLVVALISQKGGAGKSTLALHLAAEAVLRKRKALLLDLDPQGNIARWGDKRGELPPDVDAVHPANIDKELTRARAEGYDLVVLDTAPHADATAVRAAKASNLILVPCRPATFDLEAIEATLALCMNNKRTARVVLNAAPIRSRVVEEASADIRNHGAQLSPVVVRHRVAFQHCLIDGRTAGEFEPGGAAALEIAALYDDMMSSEHDTMLTRTPV